MAEFEKVEFEFPNEGDDEPTKIEIEPSGMTELGKDVEVEEEKSEPKAKEELDIEVVDDTPKKDRGRKKSDPPEEVSDEELAEYSEKVQKRIKHISKGYHDERREKEAALRERQELENLARKLIEENKTLKGSVGENQKSLLDQAKHTVARDYEEAKREYKEAYESGNSDAVIEAQDKLTTAKIRADKIGQVKLPPLQDKGDEVQLETQQPKLDEKAADWSKENTWFGSDDEMTSFALGYHNKLVKSGIDPTGEEYYEKINTRMRQVFPDNFDESGEDEQEEAETTPPPRKTPTSVVAPANRSTSPKKVRLTKTQVQIASRLGVPIEEYARQVAIEMRKENNG